MKLLVVIDSLSFGGAENMVATLGRLAQSVGLEVEVASLAGPTGERALWRPVLERAGLRLHFLSIPRLLHPGAVPTIARVVRESRCDVVHAHLGYAVTLTPAAARLVGRRTLCTFHHVPRPESGREAIREPLSIAAANRSAGVVCVSRASLEGFAARYRVRRRKWGVLHNGVDLVRFAPAPGPGPAAPPADLGIPPGVPVVSLVAHLRHEKGHPEAIDAWPEVLRSVPEARLLIVGDGPMEAQLRKRVTQLGLQHRVHFAGVRRDIPAVLRGTSVALLPTHIEALPTALIEAAGCGVPAVATWVGGVPEVVEDGVTGLLFERGDAAAIPRAVVSLLTDEARRAGMGRAARARAEEHFDAERWARRLRVVYDEAAAGRQLGLTAGGIGAPEHAGRSTFRRKRLGSLPTTAAPDHGFAQPSVTARQSRDSVHEVGSVRDRLGPISRRWRGPTGWEVEEASLAAPAVRKLWQEIQARDAVESPFLTWEWCSTLAEHSPSSQRLVVLLASWQQRPVALLPVQFRRGPGGVRTLGVAGSDWLHPDHLDVVALPDYRGPAGAAVVRYLKRRRTWDVLDLDGLTASGGLSTAVSGLRMPLAVPLSEREVVAPYVDLRGKSPVELFPSRNLRDQLRRGLRRAERSGGGFSVVTDPEEAARCLEELMSLHNQRFGARSTVFATVERRRFHAAVVRRLAGAGAARVYRLVADGVDAALLYALVHRRTVYYYSMGIRPSAGLSPGLTVLGHAILSAAAEGHDEFDLLRGDHAFKRRFAPNTRVDRRVLAARLAPRGALGVATIVIQSRQARSAAHAAESGPAAG